MREWFIGPFALCFLTNEEVFYNEKKYAIYGKRYSEEFLKEMVSECASFDMGFKSGEMDGYTGLFLLVSKLL
jgi:DNA polymerase III delta subunit